MRSREKESRFNKSRTVRMRFGGDELYHKHVFIYILLALLHCLIPMPFYFTVCDYLVPPSWRLEPRSLQVMEGSSVNIDCMAQGFPTPQITWKRLIWSGNDEMSLTSQQYQLIRSGPHYQVYENGTLRISKALMADKGGYLCQASNSIGPGLGTMVQLSVNSK